MDKLIELLNKYGTQEEIKWKWYFVPNHIQWEGCDNSECSDLLIISKKFGFIKWLVENEKIDFEGMNGHGKIISYLTDEKDYKWNDVKEGVVLMLLSIQDNPIEFLISLLK